MKTPRDKYLNDPHYNALVSMMVAHIHACNYTPSEMREAAILASILYEETRPPQSIIVPKEIADAFKILRGWRDGPGWVE